MMTDDDFDKIDDEDFASEFDFVEEADPSKGSTPAGSNPPPSGENKPPVSPQLKLILIIITVLGLGYFAYTHFFASPKIPAKPFEKPGMLPEHPALPGEGHQGNTMHEHTVPPVGEGMPLPPPSAPGETQPTATTETSAVNFAETPTNPNVTGSNQPVDHLAGAVPQSKTFAQVQRDLQTKNPTQQIPVQPAISPAISSTLDSLSEEMTVNVNQIKQLETTINTLATTVDQLNRTVAAMDNRILGLTEIADNLAQDLNNVKKVIVSDDLDLTGPGSLQFTNKKKPQTISNSAPTYSVHAIIPGRAWLKSSDGQIITVTEGDKVGDYGTVAVIDANNGIVRTSSGITFR